MEEIKKDNTKKNKKDNIHQGHRSRVREEFYANGLDGMPDHRILEMLLFFGIPYKDTNPIAHELIDRFGSFAGVLEAKTADLVSVNGMTENAACLISMILPLYKRYMDDITKRKPVLKETEEIVEFLRGKYVDANEERVYVLCFDPNHCLLNCRMINEGDISSSEFDLRKLTAAVLETNATSVIISHNHPHGITLPSNEDISATVRSYELLKTLKVQLLDHIIVSETSYNSLVNMPRFAHIFYGLDPLT